jgi:hypothetical protein
MLGFISFTEKSGKKDAGVGLRLAGVKFAPARG